MDLEEYTNQTDPIKKPIVRLKSKDYQTIWNSQGNGIIVNGFEEFTYIQLKDTKCLYCMDENGRPTVRSVFYIE